MPKRLTGRAARTSKSRTDKRFSQFERTNDRIITNVFVPNSGVFMASGIKAGLVPSPAGQIGQPIPQGGGGGGVSDEFFIVGANTSGDTSGTALTAYNGVLDTFNPDYNDIRTQATAADAIGVGVAIGPQAFVVGTTLRYGYFGAITNTNNIFRVDGPRAVTDIATLPDFGLYGENGWRFGGAAGDKALFWAALTSRAKYQVFDFAAGAWEPLVTAPVGVDQKRPDRGMPMALAPDGTIWAVEERDEEIWYYRGGVWTQIPQPPDSTRPFVGYAGYIHALSNDAVYAVYIRGSSTNYANITKWNGATWEDIIVAPNTSLFCDFSGPTGVVILDEGDGQHYALIPRLDYIFMLVDLTTGALLGEAQLPSGPGGGVIGYNPIYSASSKENIAVYWPSTGAAVDTLYRGRFDPALYASSGPDWSLVGLRRTGFQTYTGPSDAPVSGIPSWYFGARPIMACQQR